MSGSAALLLWTSVVARISEEARQSKKTEGG